MRTQRHEFDALVRKLEALGDRSPQAYKSRVVLLGLLGYAYLGFVVLVLLSLSLLFPVALFATIPIAFYIAKSCWIRVQPPQGILLRRDRAPRLFEELDEIRDRLGCPRLHVVLITEDFNAFVSQVPHLGIFGWYKNYLALGLPYLMACSPQQFKAVLAHEMAHIFGADSRVGGWIHRVDATWENLNEQMRSGNLGTWFLTPFFRRYAPYFRAYAFVLGRANEYAADRFSARITSPQRTAEELILFEIAGAYLAREFWPNFFQSTKTQPQPTESPYTAMRERLRRPWPEEKARLWLERALNRRTNTLDTHPSLTDRLRNLGERPRVPEAMGETAAEYYLEDSLELFTMELTNQWRAHVQDWWKGRYGHLQEQSKKLAELQSKLTVEQPAFDDTWNYALILEDIEGSRAALPAFRNCLALQPDNPEPLFAVGRILIDDWQEEGVQLLESAAERNADLIFPATDMLYGCFMASGRHKRAEDYYERAIIQNERLQKAQAERSVVKHTDKFVPHGLTEPQVAELHAFFARVPEIHTVYLVQKRVEYFLDKPMFVLGLVLRFGVWIRDRQELLNRLARETPFPHGYLVLFDYSGDHRMRSILSKVPSSRIFDQSWFARLRRWVRPAAGARH